MDIKVICADCGRHIGTFVRLGKRQDIEVEIHACYHKDTYDHIQEQTERIKDLEEAFGLARSMLISGEKPSEKSEAIFEQALKG